jgi:ligand-binding sensor protein
MTTAALIFLAAVPLVAAVAWVAARTRRRPAPEQLTGEAAGGSTAIPEIPLELEPDPDRSPPPATPPPGATAAETGGGGDLAIHELVDTDLLQQVLDVFVRATGLASVVTDINGVPVTSLANFSDFCMKHTRGTDEGSKRCQLCDAQGGAQAAQTGKPSVYYCHAGLVDFAVPLMARGRQIGTWLGGQVLPARPDEKRFRQIAREIGADVDEYLDDLRKIPIIPKERIDALADLLSLIANTLLRIGYARKVTEEKAIELSEQVLHAISRLTRGVQEITEPSRRLDGMVKQVTAALHATAERAGSGQSDLACTVATMQGMEDASRVITGKLEKINLESDEIRGIIGTMTQVADQTNLLSLNAAIEAEKAGQYGLGFGVVAREIRRLADQTAVSTLDIEDTIKEMHAVVSSGVKETDSFIAGVRRSANDAARVGSQLREVIEQVQVFLPQLDEVRAAVRSQTELTAELHSSMARLNEEMQAAIESMRRCFSEFDRQRTD